jgi:hypothetical protein
VGGVVTKSDLRRELTAALAESDERGSLVGFDELCDRLGAPRAGSDEVETIFRFLEANPNGDFGAPGPLVHWLEALPLADCEEAVIGSLQRRPTTHTVWMLHRVLNGTKAEDDRTRLLQVLSEVLTHPRADEQAKQHARSFLER